MEERCLKSILNILPVTCVKFSCNYILVGAGGQISVFEISHTIKLKTRFEIFENSVIHGVLENSDRSKICIFGERNVSVLKIDSTKNSYRLTDERKWRFSDWVLTCQWVGSDDHLAVLSAHNTLTLWDCVTGNKLAEVSCAQKCILLQSLELYRYSATIVSGSGWADTVVLAGTVFQQISIWTVSDTAEPCPVIHQLVGHKGVIFSVKYDERSRLISSTSDDRTVRVWSVSSTINSSLSAEDWKNASVTLVLTLFGHTARVWQSHILADRNIISVGEDSLVCLWQAAGDVISQQEAHQGAGVWCMDVSESLALVVTGGADGGVGLWPLNNNPPTDRCLPPPQDVPRRVVLLGSSQLLVSTEAGSLVHHCSGSWSTVFTNERISNYCLLETSPSKQLVALATINANVIVLRITNGEFRTIIDEDIGNGRIFSLHWLDESTLFSCQKDGKISIWSIRNSFIEAMGQVFLPASRERWTTSAVLIHNTVVYGDRGGSIHSSPVTDSDRAKEVVETVHKAHSRQGVCSLTVLRGHVWSSGRDGTIKQFMVTSHHGLDLVSSMKLPVEWLVYISDTTLFGPVVVAFHEKNVELWSMKEIRKLTSFPCGGGHRSWSCSLDEDQFFFTYLKDKTAHVLQCPLLEIARPVVKEGFHTKEINAMTHVAEGWVASAGEDGSVRLSNLCEGSWTTPVVQNIHVSSVRTLQVCHLNERKLLFSAGARAQIKVWNISLNPSMTDASMTELSSLMLRSDKRGRHWLNTVPTPDPDTRYMDLHAVQVSEYTICVLAACSDGYLRIFHYNVCDNHLSLSGSVKSSQHCLLRVSSFLCDNGMRVAVTGGTNGVVTFWSMAEDQPVLLACEHVHQSGVNGLCVAPRDGSVLVASGGDDNQLALTYFGVTTSSSRVSVQKVTSWTCSSLHSSVITGVQIVGEWLVCCGGDQRLSLLTWRLTNNMLSADIVSHKCCCVSDIKGLTVLESDGTKIVVCVYGVGVEVLEVLLVKR